MSKRKKHRRPVPKTCDPNLCDHCMYLGEGDLCVTSTAWDQRKRSL